MSNIALIFILGLLSIQAQSGVTMLRTNQSAQTIDATSPPTYSNCLASIVRFKGLMEKILSTVSFVKENVAEAKIKEEAAAELQSLSADADEISEKVKLIYASVKSAGFGLFETSDLWMAAKGVEIDRIMVKVSINKLLNINETAKNGTILTLSTTATNNETTEDEESSDSQSDDPESAEPDDSSASQDNQNGKSDETDSQTEASLPSQEIKAPTSQGSASEYIAFFESIQKKIIKMEENYENCSKKANGVKTKEESDALQEMLKQVPRFQMMVKDINKMLNESTSMKQQEKALVRENEDKIGKRIENSLKKMQEQVKKSHRQPQLSIQTNEDNNAN